MVDDLLMARFEPPAGVAPESGALLEAMANALPGMKPTTDEEDVVGNNTLRACWAAKAVWTYATTAYAGPHTSNLAAAMRTEEADTIVRDFLNDLRHLADVVGIDIDEAFAYRIHYDADVRGEID